MSRRRQPQKTGWGWVFLLIMLVLALAYVLYSAEEQDTPVPAEGGSLEVHFLDVGQADAALVVCDGHYMLIDGGNADDSSLVYAYLKEHGAGHLDCLVATHPHEDHIGGLSGALNYASVDVALCPVRENDAKVFQNMVRYLEKRGKALTVPKPGDSFDLGSARVEILGPVKEYDNVNDASIVLRIDYGETSFLFTGDMETGAEEDLLASGANVRATVLKVGHHGSDTSTGDRFLRAVSPRYAVISVGEGNKYGHPSESVLGRLRDAEVYRTDLQGHIVARSDGKHVTFTTEKAADLPANPADVAAPGAYVGNANTKRFHLPDCPSVEKIKEGNRVELPSREQAVAEGYQPCGQCKP